MREKTIEQKLVKAAKIMGGIALKFNCPGWIGVPDRLILLPGKCLAFVEVKARPSLAEAAFALGGRQRARLMAAAECWLGANPGHGAAGMRFDVVIVAADGTARRIADAFRLGD